MSADPARALGAAVAETVQRAVASKVGGDASQVALREVTRLSGGASRLTWRVRTGPPLTMVVQKERAGSSGTSLPMSTQAELLRAARGAGVPVPEVLGDGGAPGEGFVVLEWLEGESVPRKVLRDPALAGARKGLAREAGRILAAVHSIDPGRFSLAGGEPLGQMRSLLDALGEPHPAFELGLRWLERHAPPATPEVLVHGDFRMGNLLVAPGGITAVLDWELAHRGSAVEDLGWFCGRAWRFGSPLRAGGVGSVEDLLDGYAEGGGTPPSAGELRWWEAYGTLRWGLICVLQASVHLSGAHRSVELAAIGRRTAETEEDLLELISGPSAYQPPAMPGNGSAHGPHDRPTAAELLEAVQEHLDSLRDDLEGSAAFHLRVASNVVATVHREVSFGHRLDDDHGARLAGLDVADDEELGAAIRAGTLTDRLDEVTPVVRAMVRDKLAVSHPGYWHGDGGGAGADPSRAGGVAQGRAG